MQGRTGHLTGALSLSFIVETGPEAQDRICEDIVVEGNFVNTGYWAVLGSLERVGTQATDLLIAVHWFFGTAEKEAEVALIVPFTGTALEERPVRMSFDSSSTLAKRNRGTDLFTVGSVDLTDAIRFWHFGVLERMSILVTDVGLLEAATA